MSAEKATTQIKVRDSVSKASFRLMVFPFIVQNVVPLNPVLFGHHLASRQHVIMGCFAIGLAKGLSLAVIHLRAMAIGLEEPLAGHIQ